MHRTYIIGKRYRLSILRGCDSLKYREIYSGLIRIHILHHAAEAPVYGLWLIEELEHHGYRLSAGTIYPLLHSLEKRGYLKSSEERKGHTARKLYRATTVGKRALSEAKSKVKELLKELEE